MFSVKSTRRETPVRVLIHGKGGLGKSTFAANAPRCIFITSEDGLDKIDALAVEPFPTTWEQMLAQIDYVGTLDYRSIAIDSLDWFEPMCHQYVCTKHRKKDIEAFGYGKGYVAAVNEWRVMLHKLGNLRARGMHVILVAHGTRKAFKNPTGDDFEHYAIKLHEKTAALIKEWCDVVGFCEEDIAVAEINGRWKGVSTGRRVIRTQPNAAYDAKTRYMLPKSIPLDWTSFERAVQAGSQSPIVRLKADLEAKLAELGDEEVREKSRLFLLDRGENVAAFTEAILTVDAYLAEVSSERLAAE